MVSQIPQKKETAMPLAGGILVLIAGLIEIGAGVVMAVWSSAFESLLGDLGGAIAVCGIIFAVLGVVATIGGAFAIQRRNFAFALVGGILSLGGSFILGLIGLILIVLARDEFEG